MTEPARVWHLVLTLQWPAAGGFVQSGMTSQLAVAPHATRTQLLAQARAGIPVPAGCTGPGTVVFFSLEPDDLGAQHPAR